MWALTSSEAIQSMIKDKYKQTRHNDDENQALAVIHWGTDGDKRRYYLVRGQDDTGFRVYREGNRMHKGIHWYSVAEDIEGIRQQATKLKEVDGSQAARKLAIKMESAIPMFEACEEVRETVGGQLGPRQRQTNI